MTMRVFNFSAGPAALPEPVLQRAAQEMLDWHGCGMSVMEMSHRGKAFTSIIEKALADFRQLLGIPEHYQVLLLQGGALAMNALIPMNLLGDKTSADYVNTGEWSKKSIQEARKYCKVNVIASSEDRRFTGLVGIVVERLPARRVDPVHEQIRVKSRLRYKREHLAA